MPVHLEILKEVAVKRARSQREPDARLDREIAHLQKVGPIYDRWERVISNVTFAAYGRWPSTSGARAFLSREGYLQPGDEGYMNAALDGDDTRNATAASGISIYDPSPAGPPPQAPAQARSLSAPAVLSAPEAQRDAAEFPPVGAYVIDKVDDIHDVEL